MISAFHSASEPLKHVKQERSEVEDLEQLYDEFRLQEALLSDEKRIREKYAQDMIELADLVPIDDGKSSQLTHESCSR